jgi:hypothetical protein
MIPGVVYKSPGIYVTAEENAGKPQTRISLMKVVPPFIASNGVP